MCLLYRKHRRRGDCVWHLRTPHPDWCHTWSLAWKIISQCWTIDNRIFTNTVWWQDVSKQRRVKPQIWGRNGLQICASSTWGYTSAAHTYTPQALYIIDIQRSKKHCNLCYSMADWDLVSQCLHHSSVMKIKNWIKKSTSFRTKQTSGNIKYHIPKIYFINNQNLNPTIIS